jgi:dTDP-4-amino-4,6-dideoxygalactose transaminase
MGLTKTILPPKPFAKPVYVTRPLLPPLQEYERLLQGVWERRWLTNNGELLQRLESRLSEFLEAPNVSIVGNGTLALQLAIGAFRLRGEVITTPFTFPATPHVLTWAGITPVFADIDEETLTLSPAAVERAVNERTSGILGVHVYGMPCDVHSLADIAERRHLRVIYDGAHAFGTRIDGRPIGDFGDATMLSFHATKLFHSAEGGALILRDMKDMEAVELLKNFGIRDEIHVLAPGVNAKMNELQAAMGLLVLEQVEAERTARARIAAVYRARLSAASGLRVFSVPADVRDSNQYAILLIDEQKTGVSRDAVYEGLKRFNIFARRYFYPLCSEAPHYRNLPSAATENLPVAYRISRQVLALPYYSDLGENGANRVSDAILHLIGGAA